MSAENAAPPIYTNSKRRNRGRCGVCTTGREMIAKRVRLMQSFLQGMQDQLRLNKLPLFQTWRLTICTQDVIRRVGQKSRNADFGARTIHAARARPSGPQNCSTTYHEHPCVRSSTRIGACVATKSAFVMRFPNGCEAEGGFLPGLPSKVVHTVCVKHRRYWQQNDNYKAKLFGEGTLKLK